MNEFNASTNYLNTYFKYTTGCKKDILKGKNKQIPYKLKKLNHNTFENAEFTHTNFSSCNTMTKLDTKKDVK